MKAPKRALCLLLTFLLPLLLLGGCASSDSIFRQRNEIFTYQRIDPDKTQLVVSRTGNINVQPLCREFEARNPGIQVIYLDITGGNSYYTPLVDWIKSGYKPDVVFSAAGFFDEELATEYFTDLSAHPIIRLYESDALQRTAINGRVYWLPGPSSISAMMYNKTLFEQYGWEVPSTFDGFIALCARITADTDGEIQPWNPNAKYSNELLTVLEAFQYKELFGGADNRAWLNELTAGNTGFAEHMAPYIDLIDTLVKEGLLKEEHFTYSATARGNEFLEGKIAMINTDLYDAGAVSDGFEFGLMPYPTTEGELGYLCDSYSCFVGLPVKEHSEAEEEAIDSFLEFFSSEEGQRLYIGDTVKVSNVKGLSVSATAGLSALKPAIEAGHMFALIHFDSDEGLRCTLDLHKTAADLVTGAMTAEEALAMLDGPIYTSAEAAEPLPFVASVEEELSILETSFLIADMYRDAAQADVALIADNEPYMGNLMKMFPGELTEGHVTVLKPRSFANGSALVKVSMTGRQLLDALSDPVGSGDGTAECIYAFSGLRCRVAPWNPAGEKYLSVTLSDGSALEEDGVYTVAFWSGSVKEEYITGILDTFDGTWEELMIPRLTETGTISATDDGRITLVWS